MNRQSKVPTKQTIRFLYLNAGVTDQLTLRVGFGKSTETTSGVESETDQLMLAGYYKLGGGVILWSEFGKDDTDGVDAADDFWLGVRMDF